MYTLSDVKQLIELGIVREIAKYIRSEKIAIFWYEDNSRNFAVLNVGTSTRLPDWYSVEFIHYSRLYDAK